MAKLLTKTRLYYKFILVQLSNILKISLILKIELQIILIWGQSLRVYLDLC